MLDEISIFADVRGMDKVAPQRVGYGKNLVVSFFDNIVSLVGHVVSLINNVHLQLFVAGGSPPRQA
jgi:hypothetical protein